MIVRVFTTGGHFDVVTDAPEVTRQRIEGEIYNCLKQELDVMSNGTMFTRPNNTLSVKVGTATVYAQHITGIDTIEPSA